MHRGGKEVKKAKIIIYFLLSYCTDKMIMNIQRSRFDGMMFTVGRLIILQNSEYCECDMI